MLTGNLLYHMVKNKFRQTSCVRKSKLPPAEVLVREGVRKRFSGLLPFLVAVLLAVPGCLRETRVERVLFTPLGIELYGLTERSEVKLFDSEGRLLLHYPPLPTENLMLIFRWEPKEVYRLKVEDKTLLLKTPEKRIIAEVLVLAPVGSPGKRSFVYPGEGLEEDLFLASRAKCPEVAITVTSFKEDLRVEFPDPFNAKRLLKKYQRSFVKAPLCLTEKRTVVIKVGDEEVKLNFFRKDLDLTKELKLISWRLPTDESGFSARYRKEGLLAVPNPALQKFLYIVGVKEKGTSSFEPFAYQTTVIRNDSEVPLVLLLETRFFDLSGREVEGFYPKRFSKKGAFRRPVSVVYAPPRADVKAVMPIYINDVAPGEYLVELKVSIFGEKKEIFRKTKKIGVTKGSWGWGVALLVILATGLAYFVFFSTNLSRILRKFDTRELSLISLAGSLSFALDFLGGTLSNILYAFLGPFNVLVGGLVTEVVHYGVFCAIFFLIPKPGFVTLSGILHYLMSVVIFGGLKITDPFFVGARLFFTETSLLFFRCYGNSLRERRTALALSVADALNTASSLLLHTVFYRLYFPFWYIVLSVTVKGFFYTFLGAVFGIKIGKRLTLVEE